MAALSVFPINLMIGAQMQGAMGTRQINYDVGNSLGLPGRFVSVPEIAPTPETSRALDELAEWAERNKAVVSNLSVNYEKVWEREAAASEVSL